MSKVGENSEGELNHEIEEIVSRIESLSLTPAFRPPFSFVFSIYSSLNAH